MLDLACGHGRHAVPLAAGVGRLVGLDRSAAYLRRARGRDRRPATAAATPSVRVRPRRRARAAVPPTATFDAVFSWYASLFMFDDATNEACLAEAARVLRPGGRLLVHHANPARLAARADRDRPRRTLPDGSRRGGALRVRRDAGVDRCARRLVRPDGAVLAGTAELRYYTPSEWRRLAARAGLRLVEVTSTPGRGPPPRREPGPDAPDLIALLEKPT